MNERKKRKNIVYSTNPDFHYEYDEETEPDTLPPGEQNLFITIDRKQRNGKIVTIISGFTGKKSDLESLGKLLREKCGAGGTVKDNEILVQGNFPDKIILQLKSQGYRAKKINC